MAGQRGFRADIENGSGRFLQVSLSCVNGLVVMREIAMQRLFKLTPGSFFERFIIVGTRIVYDAVDMSITLVGIIDNACYVVGVIQINLVGSVICRDIFDFGSVLVVEGSAIKDDRNRTFARERKYDCLADSAHATGDDENFFVEVKVHAAPSFGSMV